MAIPLQIIEGDRASLEERTLIRASKRETSICISTKCSITAGGIDISSQKSRGKAVHNRGAFVPAGLEEKPQSFDFGLKK